MSFVRRVVTLNESSCLWGVEASLVSYQFSLMNVMGTAASERWRKIDFQTRREGKR